MKAPVYFYLPSADLPPFDRLPDDGQPVGRPGQFLSPALNWVWRTHYHLSAAGFPCQLVHQLPPAGIIVCAACNLPLLKRPGRRQLFVCCVADSPARWFVQLHVFQCMAQASAFSRSSGFPRAEFMPHWPQPGLLPRDPAHGDRVLNVDYFGAVDQLASEIKEPAFSRLLREHGFNLRFHFEYYEDYRETDVVLAVRKFGRTPVEHKPASKLINAWRAGVPALLGAEAAFRELRRSPDDYWEMETPADCLAAILRLRNNPELFRRMSSNGRARSAEFSESALLARWVSLLGISARDAHEEWQTMPTGAYLGFLTRQFLARSFRSLARRTRIE